MTKPRREGRGTSSPGNPPSGAAAAGPGGAAAGFAVEELAAKLQAGDRRALAQAITLLEGARPDQRTAAGALLTRLLPHAGKALRLGISGAPGVGKSTFIEAFGQLLLAEGHRVAVLAVDPSSPISGGSILGDRVRMETLSRDERVFIRPSPAGGMLGGVARRTREAILAVEAAGYDRVIVETVGVGQSETLAASMVDLFMILHLPNAGDEIQGIKRGILELADLVVVTKADGALVPAAKQAKGELERALMLARGAAAELPGVFAVSSTEGTGLAPLLAAVETLAASRLGSGATAARRRSQVGAWFRDEVLEQVRERLAADPALSQLATALEGEVVAGRRPAAAAATELVTRLLAGP